MKKQFLNNSIIRFAVITILIGITTVLTSAQSNFDAQVRVQLDIIKSRLAEKGFERTHNYKIEMLDNRESENFYLTLHQNWEYVLVSACDKDCSDIDIEVYDENDNLIIKDNSRDDLPVVRVKPKWTGEFRVKVSMYKCANSPCSYGIGVFGK